MKPSKSLYEMSSKNNKLFLIITAILSFLGFADSTYLTIVHYENIIPPCSITFGCEKVLTSQFATIAGMPLGLFGALFFILIFVLTILNLQKNQEILKKALSFFSASGLIAGIILFYIQWRVLYAFCQYCLLVEAILLAIFILSKLNKK